MKKKKKMNDLIENVERGIESLKDNNFYGPYGTTFKLTKEQLKILTEETEKEILIDMKRKWGLPIKRIHKTALDTED